MGLLFTVRRALCLQCVGSADYSNLGQLFTVLWVLCVLFFLHECYLVCVGSVVYSTLSILLTFLRVCCLQCYLSIAYNALGLTLQCYVSVVCSALGQWLTVL